MLEELEAWIEADVDFTAGEPSPGLVCGFGRTETNASGLCVHQQEQTDNHVNLVIVAGSIPSFVQAMRNQSCFQTCNEVMD